MISHFLDYYSPSIPFTLPRCKSRQSLPFYRTLFPSPSLSLSPFPILSSSLSGGIPFTFYRVPLRKRRGGGGANLSSSFLPPFPFSLHRAYCSSSSFPSSYRIFQSIYRSIHLFDRPNSSAVGRCPFHSFPFLPSCPPPPSSLPPSFLR